MESLWEKITDLDKLNYASQAEQPIVKSQFRMKKNAQSSQKTSIQIHLYASLILFICASTPKAKISLTTEVQYQLNSESNQLIIHKNEKSIQLRLNDSENTNKWAEALTKLGISERETLCSTLPQTTPGRIIPSYPTYPSDTTHKQISSSTPSHKSNRRDSSSSTCSLRSSCSQLDSMPSSPSYIIDHNEEKTITLQLSAPDSTCYSNACSSSSSPSSSRSEGNKGNAKANINGKNGKKNNQKLNSKRRSSQQENIYAAPETLKPSMEHFIINTTYLYRKACTNYFQYITNLRGLERIPEEQECCD